MLRTGIALRDVDNTQRRLHRPVNLYRQARIRIIDGLLRLAH